MKETVFFGEHRLEVAAALRDLGPAESDAVIEVGTSGVHAPDPHKIREPDQGAPFSPGQELSVLAIDVEPRVLPTMHGEETVATVHIVLPDGSTMDVNAHSGESIMHAAVRNNVPGILGDCGGQAACATCHVYLARENWRHFSDPKEAESDMLEYTDEATEQSRLSCQLRVSEQCHGVTLAVADNGF